MAQPAGRRPGRRPGDSGTREAILAAARTRFAGDGFDAASVRAIARDAGVDPALVLHYFGSKSELFTAAVSWPFDTEPAVAQIIGGPRSEVGRRLVGFFLSVWEDPARREPIIALLRAATTSPEAAALLREALGRRLLGPIAAHLGRPDAALRVSLCGSQLVGLGIARYIVGIEPLASMDRDAVADAVGPVLQRYLTGR